MKRAIGATLGAFAGLAFSTLGLLDTSDGFEFMKYGGNDATPTVIAVGVAVGALLGITVLWRWPLAIVGAIVGLAAGIWLRDNASMGGVQPPWVFLLLFGLPLAGAATGYLLHLPRTTWTRHATAGGLLVGVATTVIGYVASLSFWTTTIRDTSCDPMPQLDGSVVIPLCASPGTPPWVGLLAGVLGVAVGIFTHAKLDSADVAHSDGALQGS